MLRQCLEELDDCQYFELSSPEDVSQINVPKENGVVYFIYTQSSDNHELVYVGKSRGKYFRTRLRSHLFGIGKGTQSKFHKIQKLNKQTKVLIKFIELYPDSLRNFVEELLIEKFQKDNLVTWNFEKKSI